MYAFTIILGTVISLAAGYTVTPFGQKLEEPNGFYWDDKTQDLYFVDALISSLYRYNWADQTFFKAPIEGNIIPTFIVPVRNQPGKFLTSSLDLTAGIVSWDGNNSLATGFKPLFAGQNITELPANAWNFGKASPTGVFFGATANLAGLCSPTQAPNGVLNRYDNGKVTVLDNGQLIADLTWHPLKNLFYYISSCPGIINECNWNPVTNDILNCRPIFHFKDANPQVALIGLAIDTAGHLYTSAYNGGYILKIDPSNGKVLLRIDVPAETVSDLIFVGPKLDILVVSTESVTFNLTHGGAGDPPKSPLVGTLFKIEGLNARGFPNFQWSSESNYGSIWESILSILRSIFGNILNI